MLENPRLFDVTDPFGRRWQVEFRWQQNAISIRHCDSVDCKYYLSDGQEKRELVIALMHPDLLAVAAAHNRELTDPWCMHVAALHVRRIVSTWTDMDSVIVTLSRADLEAHAQAIEQALVRIREQAASSR